MRCSFQYYELCLLFDKFCFFTLQFIIHFLSCRSYVWIRFLSFSPTTNDKVCCKANTSENTVARKKYTCLCCAWGDELKLKPRKRLHQRERGGKSIPLSYHANTGGYLGNKKSYGNKRHRQMFPLLFQVFQTFTKSASVKYWTITLGKQGKRVSLFLL